MMVVCSVYDSKAEAFLMPLFFPNNAVAIRGFSEAVQTVGSPFNKFPGDYTLFAIGEWDEIAGKFTEHEAKVSLGVGTQFVGPTGGQVERDQVPLSLAR